jgi:hypothetical protein
MVGMALAGLTGGKFSVGGEPRPAPPIDRFYAGKIRADEVQRIVADCRAKGITSHDALMDACGWPAVPFDGEFLVTHQDALLVGGKVQATAGLCGPRAVPGARSLRSVRGQAVHRDVFGASNHAWLRRCAGVRSRKMHLLRRLPVELPQWRDCLPCRRRRPALQRELKTNELMTTPFQIVVCGSIVPDPLQTLEPVTAAGGPALKNEMMLPAVLDPWAGHALFEAANLARQVAG